MGLLDQLKQQAQQAAVVATIEREMSPIEKVDIALDAYREAFYEFTKWEGTYHVSNNGALCSVSYSRWNETSEAAKFSNYAEMKAKYTELETEKERTSKELLMARTKVDLLNIPVGTFVSWKTLFGGYKESYNGVVVADTPASYTCKPSHGSHGNADTARILKMQHEQRNLRVLHSASYDTKNAERRAADREASEISERNYRTSREQRNNVFNAGLVRQDCVGRLLQKYAVELEEMIAAARAEHYATYGEAPHPDSDWALTIEEANRYADLHARAQSLNLS